MSRKAISQALLSRVTTQLAPSLKFTTISREYIGIDAADSGDKLDALFLLEMPERRSVEGRGMPSKTDHSYDLTILAKVPEGCAAVDRLDDLLDLVDGCFRPTVQEKMQGGRITLGGIVYDVWIEGTIQKNPSYLGGRVCLAVIPLHVRTTQLH